ncbi:hypothetical protein [Methylocystis parvus]|uniref:hypothetical protein n=1 Tax=Methylocystis parvus TaxID=134 RepID=UPI001FCC9AEC|nr:hypothetical protein [Methylocystis parvus]WBK01292.1 hypothetical protein MMG94_06160 [Methylocystis parvus OBBP]
MSDVVLWLQLTGRKNISERRLKVIKPFRKAVVHSGEYVALNLAIKLERSVFLKRRQTELLKSFAELAPYKLVAEIAIYHPAETQVAHSQLPPRVMNCLTTLGAELNFITYIVS